MSLERRMRKAAINWYYLVLTGFMFVICHCILGMHSESRGAS
jgi:hypothetical protein